MSKQFPHSRELLDIVESKGWTLYNSATSEDLETAFTWEELDSKGPTRTFEFGNNYIFTPIKTNGQTLRQAYAVTMGVGPSFIVPSIEAHLNMNGKTFLALDKSLFYYFSRMFFVSEEIDYVLLTSPLNHPHPILMIPAQHALEKFRDLFRVITPADLQRAQYFDMPNFQPAQKRRIVTNN